MDNVIYPRPLAECRLDIVNDLRLLGRDHCGGCHKPFTAIRKLKSVSRVTHTNLQGVKHAWSWPLCRQCTREDARTGSVRERLQGDALAELVLMVATPKGAA